MAIDKDILISIGRPQRRCMNCDAEIAMLPKHPSVLKTDKGSMERWDYCPECWEVLKRDVYDSFWLSRREQKPQAPTRLTRKERNAALRALFESLWERRDSEDVGPHLYLLAHLLMKWGGLKWREARLGEDGCEIIVFEDPASGDQLALEAMDLEDEHVLAIKQEIETFLREYAPEDEVGL